MSRSSRPFGEWPEGLPERLAEVLPPDSPLRDEYGDVLGILADSGGDCGVAVLAREMVHARRSRRREEIRDPSVDATDYQSTYLALQREYLPTLVTLGVVEYDRTDGTVTLVREA
jgi:hypothetical protein